MTLLRLMLAAALIGVTFLVFRRPADASISRKLPDSAVTTINWLRGLAAVSVLLGHVRGLYMQDFEALKSPSALWKLFYLVSGLGHQAVIVFFILSGFLVGSTVLVQSARQRWDFRDYLNRRLIRLYVVLLPGLLLTFAWDSLGMRLFGTGGIYGGVFAAPHLSMPDVRVTLSTTHLAGNLAFLQHLFIAPYGTNGPLWSLSYELWAYLLFPLVVRATVKDEPTVRRAAFVLLAFAILAMGGLKLVLYFGVWLLGAGVAAWWLAGAPKSRGTWVHVSAWLGFAACTILGRSSKISDWLADPLLGLATAALVAIVLSRRAGASGTTAAWNRNASAWLANFSYTLYVAHYPLLVFCSAAFMGGQRWAPTTGSVLATLSIALAILLGYAYPLSRLTEARTDELRSRFTRRSNEALPVSDLPRPADPH